MTKTHSLFREAHKVSADFIAFSARSILVAQLSAAVVFPLIETLLKQTQSLPNYVWVIIYVIHLFFAVYAFYGFNKVKDFLKASKLDEIEQELLGHKNTANYECLRNERLTGSLASLAAQSVAAQASLSVLQSLIKDSPSTKSESKSEHVEKLLAPLIQTRSNTLQFNSSEKYNFAVYLYNKDDKTLTLFYRNCDNRILRHDRSWKVGVGHVGISFAQERTIISPDITNSVEFLGAGSIVNTDKDVYVSFISTPIFFSKNSQETPLGVLVITSDRAGHLTQEYKIVTETFALLLGVYFTNYNHNHNKEIS